MPVETVIVIGWPWVIEMDMQTMIKHYQEIFKNPNDILSWIEHDLMHMGLGDEEINNYLNEAKTVLGV